MAKTITITYENRDYTLEYTRDTVRVMEASGFIADELFVKPMLRLPELFFGAFAAHHRGLKKNVTDKIWESLPKRDELVVALVDMYRDTVNTLTAQKDEGDEGNATWTVTE